MLNIDFTGGHVRLQLKNKSLILGVISVGLFCACQAESPAKQSGAKDLLAQVEAIEADESVLLFQQAKVAAEKNDVSEARSLIQRALGRGAGEIGLADAEVAIKKAEARIAEKKRKTEEAKSARETVAISSPPGSYSHSRSENPPKSDLSFITVRVNPGSGMSERDLKLTLSRQYGSFSDSNGRSNEVQIYKPDIGSIAGEYSWRFTTTYRQSALHEQQYKSCSGPFTVSGRKSYITLHISSDCSGYAQ